MKSNRLQSDLVVLQKYTVEDLHQLFEAIRVSIDRVYPWLPWCHPNYTITETEEWLKTRPQRWDEGKEFGFSIRDRQGAIVGGCGIGIRSLPWSGNLGYWLKTGATGKGYATEATKLLVQFGIQELQLKRIEIVASVENFSSQKVAVRSGAFKEGVSRNRLLIHSKFHDAIVYSFIPQDFDR
ncbi:GNAT family N-acetyltransferase [Pleurocapsa sp. PCC 7319]|uniref:GNAT family N-acetyltransferase n=1 Tax=Pleurocapsa sp. PCC 7319 TaxID=118161 RepID=UPI0006842877|nr:GNAT family N-acetyltransferase [Pleurocapsa sp. PCC 7319]